MKTCLMVNAVVDKESTGEFTKIPTLIKLEDISSAQQYENNENWTTLNMRNGEWMCIDLHIGKLEKAMNEEFQ